MNYHHHHLTVYIFSCFPFVLIKTGVFLSFFSLSCNQNEFNLIKIRKKKKEDLVFLRRHASLSLRYDQKNSIPSPLALSGRLTTYFSDTVVSTLIKKKNFFKKTPNDAWKNWEFWIICPDSEFGLALFSLAGASRSCYRTAHTSVCGGSGGGGGGGGGWSQNPPRGETPDPGRWAPLRALPFQLKHRLFKKE